MEVLNKRKYILSIGLMNAIFWIITFLFRKFSVPNETIVIIEGIELFIIGILIAFSFSFFEDLFYAIPLICYLPFVFSRPFDIKTIPLFFYIATGISVIGIIIRFFRFKFKPKIGKMFFGLALIGVSLIIGGLNVQENEYRLTQFFMMIFVSIGLLAIYVILTSNVKKIDFSIICDLMNVLAVILLIQELTYYTTYPEDISHKALNLGWAVSNNLSLMFLFTMPFSYYKAITKSEKSRYGYLAFTGLQYVGIVLSYSRGCIVIGGLGLLFMIALGFKFFKNDLKRYIIVIICFLIVCFLFIIIICLFVEGYLEQLKHIIIDGIKLESLNGRIKIYSDWFMKSLDYPILGHGTYYPFMYYIDVKGGYQWGHCTFLHAMFTTGIIGTILLTYHMVEKYYGLIKKMNLIKFTILLSFVLSGIYGLFDVSYFYINYMVVLIVVLVLTDDYMERLLNFKFLKKYDD